MTHLMLAHLSKENNSPYLVQQLFENHAGETEIIIASRYEQTPVFRIQPGPGDPGSKETIVKSFAVIQMNMFD